MNTQNNEVTLTADQIAQFRGFYNDRFGTLTMLNAPQIEAMFTAQTDDDIANFTAEQWADLMKATEVAIGDDSDTNGIEGSADASESGVGTDVQSPAVDSATDDALVNAARAFGAKLGEGMEAISFEIAEADEKTKRGVAIILDYLQKRLTKEDWANVPDPEVKRTKENADELGNIIPSKWTYRDGNRNKSHDWYEIAISQLPGIANLKQSIEDVSAPDTANFSPANPRQEEYARWGKSRRAGEYTTLSTRYRNIVLRFRRAVALRLKIAACNEVSDVQTGLRFDKGTDGKVIGVTKQVACLFIRKKMTETADNTADEGQEPVYETLTIGTFMRLKPDADGVTNYETLMKTKERPPQPPEAAFKRPTTANEFLGAWNVMGHFVGESNNRAMFNKHFATLKPAEQLIVARDFQSVYLDATTIYNTVLPVIERAEAQARNLKANAGLATRKAS